MVRVLVEVGCSDSDMKRATRRVKNLENEGSAQVGSTGEGDADLAIFGRCASKTKNSIGRADLKSTSDFILEYIPMVKNFAKGFGGEGEL